MDSAGGLQVHPQVWWFDVRTHRPQYRAVLLRFITVKGVKQNQQREKAQEMKSGRNQVQTSLKSPLLWHVGTIWIWNQLACTSCLCHFLSPFTLTWILELSSISSSSHKRLHNDDRGWDGWMASPTWWIWVWASSGSWWWTGRPCMLQSRASQRVGQDWTTILNWTDFWFKKSALYSFQRNGDATFYNSTQSLFKYWSSV